VQIGRDFDVCYDLYMLGVLALLPNSQGGAVSAAGAALFFILQAYAYKLVCCS